MSLTCAAAHGKTAQLRNKSRTASASQEITLCAVGDILSDRGVARKIEQHGLGYPFKKVAPILRNADTTFGNLECPIAERGTPVMKRFVYEARPQYTPILRDAGFDILSLANNHTLDCGRSGLLETMVHLPANDIQFFGAGNTRREAARVLNIRGVRVAFVGFCEFLPEGVSNDEAKPGTAFASIENVTRAVSAARKDADVVISTEILPMRLVGFRPQPTAASEAKPILSRLAMLLRERNTRVVNGRIAIRTN